MSIMGQSEKDILSTHLKSSHSFLEFGSGESTIIASGLRNIKSIISVESSSDFIDENLINNLLIKKALFSRKLRFHRINIGETKIWGYPKDESRKKYWPEYSSSVFNITNNFDLVLIDGRFRVACILNCLLNIKSNCTIIVHDFWNRPEYHEVLDFLSIKTKIETLGVFQQKEIQNQHLKKKMKHLLKKYEFIP